MKTIQNYFNVKALILCFGAFLIFSCSDDENDSQVQALGEDEIEVIIKSSLVDEGGIIGDINYMSNSLSNTQGRSANQAVTMSSDLSVVNCNQTVSGSYQNSNSVGPRSWTLQTNWSWTLNCDFQNNEASFDLTGNGSLDFDGPNLSKDITRAHNFNITGLEPASTEWLYNADHSRNGFIQSNVGNQNSMTTTLNYASTDILVSKATQEILSGSFIINFTATLPNGNVVNRGGTVVFNGNQTATVTLNNGTTFNVSW